VGPGRSLDAAFDLEASVPAGNYHVIYDGIILFAVDVTFDLIHRSGDTDTTLATWTQHFEPLPDGVYEAQPFEIDQATAAIDFKAGDQLVYRYTGANSESTMSYIPVGSIESEGGRHTQIALPR
jgi:hypothetical protein